MDASQVTFDQVAQLRDFVDEPEDDSTYTDDDLKSKIAAANGNIPAVAYYVWVAKAARLSALVDITEGGSSRRNSQLYTAAKSMIDHFQPYIPSDPVNTGGRTSRTRAIVRP